MPGASSGTLNNWTLFPQTSDNEVLDGTNNAINVTFDRDIQPGSFTPENVLGVVGPLGRSPTTP